jgi:hypothetical protein
VGAVAVELYLRSEDPEKKWYDGRALAESVKSLSWRFSVGSEPFPMTLKLEDAEKSFLDQVGNLLHDAHESSVLPSDAAIISNAMRDLRVQNHEERRSTYLDGRIRDQRHWYTSKAKKNESAAHRWRVLLVGIEVLGVVAALLRALDIITVDLAGIVAAAIAAGIAWVGVRQYATYARAYTFAANDLAIVERRLEITHDEASWAAEVSDAEEAISREHTMWRASRAHATTAH